ncbi:hypothetical protein WR25_01337 [Diploscapter pachys]|uniref:Uncharacterized protein n=1 Tax=Diploscapter pachys TaxID=2018661 RepID=A0A2A2JA87_9BILA|nr:hypothetical protein WR25_01337 [Diploscapter pachys]
MLSRPHSSSFLLRPLVCRLTRGTCHFHLCAAALKFAIRRHSLFVPAEVALRSVDRVHRAEGDGKDLKQIEQKRGNGRGKIWRRRRTGRESSESMESDAKGPKETYAPQYTPEEIKKSER